MNVRGREPGWGKRMGTLEALRRVPFGPCVLQGFFHGFSSERVSFEDKWC